MEGHDPCRKLATINDLPSELLLLIFNFYFSIIFYSPGQQYDPWEDIDLKSETIWPRWLTGHSLDLFPYAFASVCQKWNNVMRTNPLFWTRIVIFIDEKLSVRQAKAHLELSGNFAINLTVTRRSRDAFVDDPAEEHTITKSIMQTIAPHIPRCCTISFDLAHTSSLPRLTTDFHHRALLLNGLSLIAAATNGLGGLNGSTKFKLATIFPQVSYLDIDGHNFVDIFRHEPDWFTYFTLNGLEIQEQSMLYIRNYKPDAGENPQGRFFVFDAFEVFDYFGDLGLHNVDFDYTARSTSEMNAISNTDIYLDDFKLSDLSAQLTAVLVSNIRAQHLSIINCPLRDVTVFQECIDLSLGNINFPRTALDLRFLLSSWRGTDLSLFDCTIDDTVLEMMGSPRLGPELELNAPRLEHLLLCHCSGVSEEAVVSLREAREAFNRNDVEKYFNVVVRAPVIS